MYKIIFYKDNNEKNEVVEFIKNLRNQNSKDAKINLNKITAYIKHIEDNIWELRPLKNRILFANYYDNEFIILSIFSKKTRKTPQKEIQKAKKLLKDYIDRSEE